LERRGGEGGQGGFAAFSGGGGGVKLPSIRKGEKKWGIPSIRKRSWEETSGRALGYAFLFKVPKGKRACRREVQKGELRKVPMKAGEREGQAT